MARWREGMAVGLGGVRATGRRQWAGFGVGGVELGGAWGD